MTIQSLNSRFNRTVFWRTFLLLCIVESCLFLTGCTSAWITAIGALLPSIGAVANAILAFMAALQGKTVSAATYAAIQKWQQNVAAEIENAQTLIAAAKSNATAGTMAQIQAVMQAILQSFNSILSGVDVTDAATVAKFTQFLALGIAAANAVLALIPLAVSKMQAKASKEELAHYDKLGAAAVDNAVNTMKETYVAIIAEHTVNEDVNAALDALPRTI